MVVACYIPPGYTKQKGHGALDHVENVVIEMKRKYQDPFVVVTGNFNQWKIGECLSGFPDIKETKIGNTRGSRAIDRFFTNMSRSVVEAGTLDPLETEGEGENTKKVTIGWVFVRSDCLGERLTSGLHIVTDTLTTSRWCCSGNGWSCTTGRPS